MPMHCPASRNSMAAMVTRSDWPATVRWEKQKRCPASKSLRTHFFFNSY